MESLSKSGLEEQIEEKETKEIGLLDSGFPLLKEFREKTPGTHKHSQSLMGMVENVCSSIDINPEILKTAAMYHDIGKIIAPGLFSENQLGDDNIHDKLDPWVSFLLMSRHVSDSVMILTDNTFPTEVIRIVSQHHGQCVMESMYNKALKKDKSLSDKTFRYQTPKPGSIEALILMLCDNLEASSRSLFVTQKKSPDPEELVTSTYSRLLLDGQFDDVEVRLGLIGKIQMALVTDVASNFQKRVEYEEKPNPEEEDGVKELTVKEE